ncbi:ABC transporter ATP-binding protein [Polyangium jinanense]|nr:ABC transporter ATP-binding protein [Polyangium jinanense]
MRVERAAMECFNLSKVYGNGETAVHAVNAVSARFERAQFTAIMGPSGSGKTTLLHLLAGLDTPTRGKVEIDGRDITALGDRELTDLRRDRIGFIFQAFNLLPTLTAEQNILLPLKLSGRRPDRPFLDQIVSSLGLSDRLSHRPGELSGGQQQRVAVARALLTRPAVIFADEPTGALDLATGRALLTGLRDACRTLGQTIVMVTHDPVAATYADRVLFMADGHLRYEIIKPAQDSVLTAMKSLSEEVTP